MPCLLTCKVLPQENNDINDEISALKWLSRSPKVKSVMTLYQKVNAISVWKFHGFMTKCAIFRFCCDTIYPNKTKFAAHTSRVLNK